MIDTPPSTTTADFRIRLHVWPESAEPSRGESNPHSHRWEFASTIIAGEGLHMAGFRETTEGGKAHNRYRYGADPANPAALLADGEARLEVENRPGFGRDEGAALTLEIVNHLRHPVFLHPGTRIFNLMLFATTGSDRRPPAEGTCHAAGFILVLYLGAR
ncbi:hypothetical protein AB0E54_23540 [Amycolatopsis coloradensis]|nr:hypothetical protein [Amycolatopsis coloradensis]